MGPYCVSVRERLSVLDSSSSLVEVTVDYATHFDDMHVEKHKGKHCQASISEFSSLNFPISPPCCGTLLP